MRNSARYDFLQLGAEWQLEEREDGKAFARLKKEIEVSPNDDRQYRFIILRNGLRALLIADAKTDKAAAALGVQVGHLSDPYELPGLAHFCEHMLFLGTEEYSDEREYKTYLSQNSGASNAYTSLAETVYHFDCSPQGLPGALSRHAQFFTAPLFHASCTEREVNAVDSEFRRNLQLDARRLFQLGKALSSPASPYDKFGTGSAETLWKDPIARGVDVRERLLEWYGENYSASLMNLVVISNHTLDDLAKMVVDEYSDVANSNLAPEEYLSPPISAKEGKTEISYRTVKDSPQLRIEFGLPDLRAHWATKPGRYLSHYVGHEGPGSILADLKARGWASSLSSSCDNGARGFEFFRINISLTAIGLQNYKSVLYVVFAYLDLLKSLPPQQWAWEEMQQLGKIGWRWKEKGQPQSTARNLASQLGETLYPSEKMLVGPWYATKWDSDIVRRVLECIKVENCRVFVGSKDPLPGRAFWKGTEKYYGTEYDQYALDVERLKVPLSPPADLALPDKNIFIPSSLELVTEEPAREPFMRPTLARKSTKSQLWMKEDDIWCIPRGTAYFVLQSPLADQTPRHAVLTQLFTLIVEEALAKQLYDASLAGLDYSFGTESDGVMLCVSGYTEKVPLLAEVVMQKVKGLEVEPKAFELVHDRLVRAYRNAKLNNPYQVADSHLRHFTRQTYWTWDERLDSLQGLRPTDVQSHASSMLSELRIKSLVHGNFRQSDAVEMLEAVERTLQAHEADPAQNDYHRALILPSGTTTVYRPPVSSPENVNSAASIYYDVGSSTDDKLMAELALFAQIAKVPIFSTLRTVEQLGYIVASSTWVINAHGGFRVVLQSERNSEYLDERVDTLWSGFGEYLDKITEEEFAKERESLALKKLEKAKSLGQETGRYWQEIETGELDFFGRERQAALLRQLDKTAILAFFNRYISPSSPSRTKLAILLRSQRLQPTTLESFVSTVSTAYPSEAEAADSLATGKPTLPQVEAFVAALSNEASNEIAEEVSIELEKLRGLPKLPDGVRELAEEDIDTFRASLTRGEPYKPRETYEEDLGAQAHL
ncbi:hypothetical protein JCM11641_000219 [Rhodosporidiobolus odoratus]